MRSTKLMWVCNERNKKILGPDRAWLASIPPEGLTAQVRNLTKSPYVRVRWTVRRDPSSWIRRVDLSAIVTRDPDGAAKIKYPGWWRRQSGPNGPNLFAGYNISLGGTGFVTTNELELFYGAIGEAEKFLKEIRP